MPSVDPSNTYLEEVAGISFTVRELKASGVRDIANVMLAIQKEQSPIAMLDTVTGCVLRHVVGWDRSEPLNAASLEDALTLPQIVALLRAAASGSRLTDEQRKKSE